VPRGPASLVLGRARSPDQGIGGKPRCCSGVRAHQRSRRSREASGQSTAPSGRRKPPELSKAIQAPAPGPSAHSNSLRPKRRFLALFFPPFVVMALSTPSAVSSSTAFGLAWHSRWNGFGVSRRWGVHRDAGSRSSGSARAGAPGPWGELQALRQGYRGSAAIPEARIQHQMAIKTGPNREVLPARQVAHTPLQPRQSVAKIFGENFHFLMTRSFVVVGLAVVLASAGSAHAAPTTFSFNAGDKGHTSLTKIVDGITLTLSSFSSGPRSGADSDGLVVYCVKPPLTSTTPCRHDGILSPTPAT
jgi:hypothetical protein